MTCNWNLFNFTFPLEFIRFKCQVEEVRREEAQSNNNIPAEEHFTTRCIKLEGVGVSFVVARIPFLMHWGTVFGDEFYFILLCYIITNLLLFSVHYYYLYTWTGGTVSLARAVLTNWLDGDYFELCATRGLIIVVDRGGGCYKTTTPTHTGKIGMRMSVWYRPHWNGWLGLAAYKDPTE